MPARYNVVTEHINTTVSMFLNCPYDVSWPPIVNHITNLTDQTNTTTFVTQLREEVYAQ